MISDTLSQAAAEIRQYLAGHPATYAEQREDIDALLIRMDALRIELDTPCHWQDARKLAWEAAEMNAPQRPGT